jgi:hypothetical protein
VGGRHRDGPGKRLDRNLVKCQGDRMVSGRPAHLPRERGGGRIRRLRSVAVVAPRKVFPPHRVGERRRRQELRPRRHSGRRAALVTFFFLRREQKRPNKLERLIIEY